MAEVSAVVPWQPASDVQPSDSFKRLTGLAASGEKGDQWALQIKATRSCPQSPIPSPSLERLEIFQQRRALRFAQGGGKVMPCGGLAGDVGVEVRAALGGRGGFLRQAVILLDL